MNLLTSINNVLMFINDHWTEITIGIALVLLLVKKIKAFMDQSDEEKIQNALKQAKEIILDSVTRAEVDYSDWKKSGAIKRAQVLNEIFAKYPILSKVTDQETLIKILDSYIDEALETLRTIIDTNLDANKDAYKGRFEEENNKPESGE